MPLEIIDYLPINDNLLVIVNSLDLAIFREASHSCGLAAPEDRQFEDIPFWNNASLSSFYPQQRCRFTSRLLCDFPPSFLTAEYFDEVP